MEFTAKSTSDQSPFPRNKNAMQPAGDKTQLGNLKALRIIAATIFSFPECESKDNWLKLIKHKIGAINWNCCYNIMFTVAITQKQAYPVSQYLGF